MTDQDYVAVIAKTADGAKALNFIIRTVCGFMDSNSNYSDSLKMAYYDGRKSVAYDLKDLMGEELFLAILANNISVARYGRNSSN